MQSHRISHVRSSFRVVAGSLYRWIGVDEKAPWLRLRMFGAVNEEAESESGTVNEKGGTDLAFHLCSCPEIKMLQLECLIFS